jgi:hypothetical protein
VIDAPTATLIASGLATFVALLGFVAVFYYKLGKLEQGLAGNRELTLAESRRLSDKMDADYARLSDKMDAQHTETMAAIQRLTDAFLSHSHDDDGNIIFRIPPGSGPD